MRIVSVGSSSSGNSYIIATDRATIILDAGLPAKRIINALAEIGRAPEDVDAVLITHEHTDHVKSVRAVGRQCPKAVFYASRGTVDNVANFRYIDEERINIVEAGDAVEIEDAACLAFALSHDAAEPLGFTISSAGEKLAVVTDCGTVTDEIYDVIKDADLLVFESNHDEQMLMYGEYPYQLKVRIKGDRGHLSNECAAETLTSILKHRKLRRSAQEEKYIAPLRIMLAHLSFHNNAPYFARQTVEEAMEEGGFERDRDYILEVAAKDEISFMPGMES